MGWASEQLSVVSENFVAFCRSSECGAESPVLDIGAAFGSVTLAALEAGACVIANDISPDPLAELLDRATEEQRTRLSFRPGRFPSEIHFEPNTLGAVHASNVLHFLTGNQLEYGMRGISSWLRPGGCLFVQAATPWMKPFEAFVPEYETRVASGERWPGRIAKVSQWSTHRQISQMPRSIHLLDQHILRRTAEAAGFQVDRAWTYRRADLPATLWLDGRESVGLIAHKPL